MHHEIRGFRKAVENPWITRYNNAFEIMTRSELAFPGWFILLSLWATPLLGVQVNLCQASLQRLVSAGESSLCQAQ